ncbi:MAG: FHIPEP family type III secretion protein [Vulcanimicrobiota bacterium]
MKDNQGKIEDFLAELELKHLQGGKGSSQLSPGFSSRLDEFAKSIFEDSQLTQNFTTELRYGLGSALGCKLVEMMWDDLSPALGDTSSQESVPELKICLAATQLEEVKSNWNMTAVAFSRYTGVLLPAVQFEESEKPAVYLRALELGSFPATLDGEETGEFILELLKEQAYRFLTFEQVGDKLRKLWTSKPKLYQASREERVPLRTYVFVLRQLLKAGVPVRDMDLIIDSLFLNLGLDDLGAIAENVLEDIEELICGKREPVTKPRTSHDLSIVDEVAVELGHELAPFMSRAESPNLIDCINKSRRLTARDFGWVMPTVSIRVNYDLSPREYQVLIRGTRVFKSEVSPDEWFITGTSRKLASIKGREFLDPVYGVPAKWIKGSSKERAERQGMIVIDPLTFIGVVVTETSLEQAHRLFTYEAFDEMLDALEAGNGGLVRMYRENSALRCLAKAVFCNLLRERVPILDKNSILECILQRQTLDASQLTEIVRTEIKESLYQDLLVEEKRLSAVLLSGELEGYLAGALTERGLQFGEVEAGRLLDSFEKGIKSTGFEGHRALIVTTARLRPALRAFLQERLPRVAVLSKEEIPREIEVVCKRTLTEI